MNVKLTTVTPEWAEETLKKNIGNRPLNVQHVDKLAKEMTNGRWKVNGDTICLNGSRVIDGQHRLHAVVQSGITIETLVVEGLSSDVFDTKDVGKRRSAGDTLGVAGEKNACRLAAALILIDKYFTGRVEKASPTRTLRWRSYWSNTLNRARASKYQWERKVSSLRLCWMPATTCSREKTL